MSFLSDTLGRYTGQTMSAGDNDNMIDPFPDDTVSVLLPNQSSQFPIPFISPQEQKAVTKQNNAITPSKILTGIKSALTTPPAKNGSVVPSTNKKSSAGKDILIVGSILLGMFGIYKLATHKSKRRRR